MHRCLTLLLGLLWISSALALTPVIGFDHNRYLGTWYEIAAIPGFLQSRCARDTQTEYTAAEKRRHCRQDPLHARRWHVGTQ